MNCPKCGSGDTYRKNPQDLTVWCDACGHSFRDNQPKRPIVSTKVYKKLAPRGTHNVQVWLCPTDPTKYSFCITFGVGIAYMGEFSSDPYLSGAYITPQLAMEAGIRWVRGETHD